MGRWEFSFKENSYLPQKKYCLLNPTHTQTREQVNAHLFCHELIFNPSYTYSKIFRN